MFDKKEILLLFLFLIFFIEVSSVSKLYWIVHSIFSYAYFLNSTHKIQQITHIKTVCYFHVQIEIVQKQCVHTIYVCISFVWPNHFSSLILYCFATFIDLVQKKNLSCCRKWTEKSDQNARKSNFIVYS